MLYTSATEWHALLSDHIPVDVKEGYLAEILLQANNWKREGEERTTPWVGAGKGVTTSFLCSIICVLLKLGKYTIILSFISSYTCDFTNGAVRQVCNGWCVLLVTSVDSWLGYNYHYFIIQCVQILDKFYQRIMNSVFSFAYNSSDWFTNRPSSRYFTPRPAECC